MRSLRAVMAALAILGSGSAMGQVPDNLFTGTARPITAHGQGTWCALDVGPALFRRRSAQQALITLPPLYYVQMSASGGAYYGLSGQAQMMFTDATSGTLRFVQPKTYPAKILNPKFLNYMEEYNAATGALAVRFRLRFPDCAIVVVADY